MTSLTACGRRPDSGSSGVRLLAEIGAEDPIAKECFELASRGIDKPEEQAALLGCPVAEIYEANRRTKYHAQRIRSKWEAPENLRMKELRERAADVEDSGEESRP